MSEKMKAGVLHGPGRVSIEQVPIPAPGPQDLLIRVAVCGVCGSDIPRMNFAGAHRHPIICGHEFSGYVEKIGLNVGEGKFELDDLVTVPPLLPCRICESCRAGHFSLCENYDYFGSRRDGAYAEYVVVPAEIAMKLPKSLDPRAAAMVDPAAIALHAVYRTGLSHGMSVAVVGAGPIGLFAVQWARLLGADFVMAVDVSFEKAAMALEAGADVAVSSDAEAVAQRSRGFDVVIESAGAPAAVALAVSLAARRGEVAYIGIPQETVEFDKATFSRLLRHEVSLHGCWNSFSAPFPGREWRESAERLASGELSWEFMITHELPLEELPSMMKILADRSEFSSKVLFFPGR